MAIRIPIITDLQDKGIKDAQKAFGDFKVAVANAEGGLGKFKAGSTAIFDAVKANAATFALAAGAAVGKFVLDGMAAFQDLAISAGKFADATGLAVEDASRYIEAAGDIGIPIDAVEGAIGRLNKTIGADPDKVRNLGVDLVYLKDGSLDVNKTFLNTIDRLKKIKDPAEKAKVAAQLLGKGWQSMAELIEMGADDLNASLKEVSEQKVISEDELRMAREYRAAMDGLGDSADDLKMKSGQRLIPMVTFLTQGATAALEFDEKVTELFKDIVGNGTQAEEQLSDLAGVLNDNRINTDNFKSAIQRANRDALNPFKITLNDTWKEVQNIDRAWQDLIGRLETDVAIDNARTSLDELGTAAAQAFTTGSTEDIAAYREQLLKATTDIMNLALNMDDISSHKVKVLVDKGDLEGALLLIGQIKAFQKTYGNVSDPYAAMAGAANLSSLAGLDFSGFKASGGPVSGGSSYIVGEKGPELFTPGASGSITPNHALGGGANITVNVTGGDPNSIVRALQQYVRNSGPLPVSIQ
jgi:hypothetical protein